MRAVSIRLASDTNLVRTAAGEPHLLRPGHQYAVRVLVSEYRVLVDGVWCRLPAPVERRMRQVRR